MNSWWFLVIHNNSFILLFILTILSNSKEFLAIQNNCRTPCGDRPPPPRFVAWLCDSIGNCCRHSVEWVIVFGRFLAMFWYLGASCHCHANNCPQACGGMVFASKWCPKWKQNRSQMAPWRPPGASWHPGGFLERSWRPLGAILEGSRVEHKIS